MDRFMEAAIEEARQGADEGGIPIGSVLVHGEEILGRGRNRRLQQGSVIRHGEMDALERAGRQPASRYRGCTLYTTLSPCPMCCGAVLLYGIPRVVIGERDTFLGAEDWLRQHGVTVELVDSEACKSMMAEFIRDHPEEWDEDIGM